MANTKLTTVKIIKDIYSKFKRLSFDSNITLQKLVNRSVDKYVEDDLFRTEINEYQNFNTPARLFYVRLSSASTFAALSTTGGRQGVGLA